jgi:hypothetical protein
LASTSHAIGDERAFVLSDGAANLRNEVLVRVVSCRAIDKHHVDSMPLEFFEENHLVHVVARKTVGSADQHHIEGCPCCLVTQGIETGSLELGSSVAVIPENMWFLDDPTRSLSDVGPQERYLLFDRLGLLLPLRRYSDIERCSHDRLLLLAKSSLPSAAGVGTRDPTVAAHPGRRPAPVPPASFCAPAFPRTEFVFSTEVAIGESSIPVGTRLPIPVGPVPPLEAQPGWTRPAEFVICEQPIEEIFGWLKTTGGFRRTRYRGLAKTQMAGYLAASAYNLVRMVRLVAAAKPA